MRLVTNTEIIGVSAILPPLPKCQHCPVVVDLYIEVKDDSNSFNVLPSNKGNYSAIDQELERNNWKSMFEGQTIYQCYGTFLNVINNLVEFYVPFTTRQVKVVSFEIYFT